MVARKKPSARTVSTKAVDVPGGYSRVAGLAVEYAIRSRRAVTGIAFSFLGGIAAVVSSTSVPDAGTPGIVATVSLSVLSLFGTAIWLVAGRWLRENRATLVNANVVDKRDQTRVVLLAGHASAPLVASVFSMAALLILIGSECASSEPTVTADGAATDAGVAAHHSSDAGTPRDAPDEVEAIDASLAQLDAGSRVSPLVLPESTRDGLPTVDLYDDCESDSAGTCLSRAARSEREGDLDGAAQHYRGACFLRSGRACAALRLLLDTSPAVLTPPIAGSDLDPRICETTGVRAASRSHRAAACLRIAANLIEQGEAAESATLVRRAAELGSPAGTYEYGRRLFAGLGVPQNRREALRLFLAACDSGIASGCADAATMLARGLTGVPPDPAQARTLFVRGCEGGIPFACFNAAFMYRWGRGGPADRSEYLRLQTLGCTLDPREECD